MSFVNLTPPGAVRVDFIGKGISVHHYEDGAIRISHPCREIDGDQLRVAPALRLGEGHTVVQDRPLTIVASVLCPDCGLHGFITDGTWRSV